MKNIKAFALSTIISTVIITISTIIELLSLSFRNNLEALTGNHWISQSMIGIVSFVILSVIFCYIFKPDNKNSAKYIWGTFFAVLSCTIVLLLFFVFHAQV